jgi:hypothetical protein
MELSKLPAGTKLKIEPPVGRTGTSLAGSLSATAKKMKLKKILFLTRGDECYCQILF